MPSAIQIRLSRPPVLDRAGIVHPLWGIGAQFDTDLFTEHGQPEGLAPEQLAELEAVLKRLRPGHSRIFVRNWSASTPTIPAPTSRSRMNGEKFLDILSRPHR
jgi:hypothetical protein